jgi:hypothetical protein
MKNTDIFIKLSVLLLISSTSTALHAENVLQYHFPSDYYHNNTNIVNEAGFIVEINNYKILNFASYDATDTKISCDKIKDLYDNDGTSRGTKCISGVTYNCENLYNNEKITNVATRDRQRMVPNEPVSYWVDKVKTYNPSKDWIGINTNHFNTDALPGRNTSESVWKPIYQEACGRTYGTHKSRAAASWYSNNGDRESFNGALDRPFGTVIFHKWSTTNSTHGPHLSMSKSTSIDNNVTWEDTAIAGTFVRWNGNDEDLADSNTVPEFVKEKAFSPNGRTILGINHNTGRMKILVIQPGRGRGSDGVTIAQARAAIGSKYEFPYVLNLDGSGSSQFASTRNAGKKVGESYFAERTDCLLDEADGGEIAECTRRGDNAADGFISHWAARYREGEGVTVGTTRIDRPVPAYMIFENN